MITKDRLFIATMAEDAYKQITENDTGVEIDNFADPGNLDGEKASAVLDALRKKNFFGCAPEKRFFHSSFAELHPAAVDHAALELAYSRWRRNIELARLCGVSRMVVHSGYVPFEYVKSWHIERSAAVWPDLLSAEKDFTIYIENVMEDEPEMMLDMIERIDAANIKLCLDIGHANFFGSIPVEKWIAVLGKHIGHFHLHNNCGDADSHLAPDEGSADMSKIFEAIAHYCDDTYTMTIESRKAGKAYEWMEKEGLLNE